MRVSYILSLYQRKENLILKYELILVFSSVNCSIFGGDYVLTYRQGHIKLKTLLWDILETLHLRVRWIHKINLVLL